MEKQQQIANRAARREIANNALALLEAENARKQLFITKTLDDADVWIHEVSIIILMIY